jgi:hypothetical protein
MDVHELRQRCLPLFECNTIERCIQLLDIYSNFFIKVIHAHQLEPVASIADAQAKIILQMMFTKCQHLKSIISGIHYKADNGVEINNIIDPTVVAALIRNFYETIAMFHLIYKHTKSPDEKLILYNLWVHAGLSYRQRFTTQITTEENKKKSEQEKNMMAELVREIENTELFKGLDEKNRKKLQQKLKDKDYLMTFDGNNVQFLHWHDIISLLEIKENLLENIYTYLSLYAHPSNVSVFQFADMFSQEGNEFIGLTTFNLKNAFILISTFISDYIQAFPKVLATFNSLSVVDQIVINFHNKFARGDKYSINDASKHLQ